MKKRITIITSLIFMLFALETIAQVAVSKAYDWRDDPQVSQIDLQERIKRAVRDINMTSWGYSNSFDEYNSSFIEKGMFFTNRMGLGGASSYLVLYMNGGTQYIFKNVPYKVWDGLKKASSKGAYFNYYIKGSYSL